jgi:aminopeptidase N
LGVGAAAVAAVAVAGYATYSMMGSEKSTTGEETAPSGSKGSNVLKDEGTDEMRTLYRTDANKRAEIIKDVSYKIGYALIRGGKTFHGQVLIKFTLSSVEDTFLDYTGESLSWVRVNGKEITDYNPFANDKINIKKEYLVAGANEIEAKFESRYVRDCEGIHYYKDTADDEEYLYSQFEAASAHKAFPCFD